MSSLNGEITDEPEDFQDSGEDWTPSSHKKRSSLRRMSQRTRKKPKRSSSCDSSDSEDNLKPRAEVVKKQRKAPPQKSKGLKINSIPSYSTGTFVVSKKDLQVGDRKKTPCVWRIDGKALLQKFEPVQEGDEILHKSTSIYSGWSPLEKDSYAPINVDVRNHSNQPTLIHIDLDALRNIVDDSD